MRRNAGAAATQAAALSAVAVAALVFANTPEAAAAAAAAGTPFPAATHVEWAGGPHSVYLDRDRSEYAELGLRISLLLEKGRPVPIGRKKGECPPALAAVLAADGKVEGRVITGESGEGDEKRLTWGWAYVGPQPEVSTDTTAAAAEPVPEAGAAPSEEAAGPQE